MEQVKDGWQLNDAGTQAKMSRLIGDALVERISMLKVVSYPSHVPEEAFKQVVGQTHIRLKDDRVVSLKIGKKFGSGRYAYLSDSPKRVFVLAESSLRILNPSRTDLLNSP